MNLFIFISYIVYKNMKKFRLYIFLNRNYYILNIVNGRKYVIKNFIIEF